EQLHKAMQMIEEQGKGVIIYMQQEGRGIGLMNKIAAYKLQEQGSYANSLHHPTRREHQQCPCQSVH
ncbi:MAG: hypothetical protein II092_00660, partial [Lachnospiraceae bacterium]|nr:hypothetical protein [Lachnospiraceae bacterium]